MKNKMDKKIVAAIVPLLLSFIGLPLLYSIKDSNPMYFGIIYLLSIVFGILLYKSILNYITVSNKKQPQVKLEILFATIIAAYTIDAIFMPYIFFIHNIVFKDIIMTLSVSISILFLPFIYGYFSQSFVKKYS